MDLFERAAAKTGTGDEETVEGTLLRVVFAGRGGEYTVARLKVDGAGELLTVVGTLLGVPVGARLRVRGRRETDPRYGPQLRLTGYTEVAPQTVEGLRRYLGSGLIKGIGPEFAGRIVETFGVRTLEVLDTAPDRIAEVPGIGRVRAQSVKEAWVRQREVGRVMVFLQGYGVSPAFAARVYRRYGASAIARVRENPYRLAFDVWGIGFLSADRLATALGVARDADVRVEAGVRHALSEAATGGHCYVPRTRLIDLAAERLEVGRRADPAGDRAAGAGGRGGARAADRATRRCSMRRSTGPSGRWRPGSSGWRRRPPRSRCRTTRWRRPSRCTSARRTWCSRGSRRRRSARCCATRWW